MNRIEEIKGRLNKIDKNMEIYRCSFSPDNYACGIYKNENLDHSHDECHHPLSSDLAEYIVNSPADIQHLLAKLEIAEKALEKLVVMENGDSGFHIAEEALQQLRS